MSFSMTEVLYEWMHELRIVSAVAQEMGIKESTLSAELRPTNAHAKLGVDELVPLFNAIRKIGYGTELEGIQHRFIGALRDSNLTEMPETDMVPQVLALARGLGILCDCAGRIPQLSDTAELSRLCTMLRTEILPVVLKMESMMASRLKDIRREEAAELARQKLLLIHPSLS
jgi:hypothetical protein